MGAADVHVHAGDRIWWDYRDWSGAMSVPAVVGSWPQPFTEGSRASARPVPIECLGGGSACASAADALRGAGVRPTIDRGESSAPSGVPKIVVGPWARVRKDPAVDGLRGGPAQNGVFARFDEPLRGVYHLIALDQTTAPARDLGPRAGLVAALRPGDGDVTWIVTGSARPAVRNAVDQLDEGSLRDRYSIAALPGNRAEALPLANGAGG